VNEKRIVVWVQHFADRPYLMLQWHDPVTGKRKSQSAKTNNPVDAEHRRADLECRLNDGTYKAAVRYSWARFRELFEAEYVGPLRPNTRLNFAKVLDLFEKLAGPRNLGGITVRTISAFAAAMRTASVRGGRRGYAPGTVKVYLQFLHTALSWAAGQELLAKVPEFPRAEVLEKTPQPVPAEPVEKLLAKVPDQPSRVFLLCGWLAGLRLAEAYTLEWEPTDKAPYLDLGRDRIVFPAEFVKGKRDQWVPLDPQLRAALEALPRTGPRVFRLRGKKGPVTLAGMSQRIRWFAQRAGVRITMKTLRRGFGCRYAGRVPAQVLQKLMRHTNIKITMTYYANVDDAVEEAVLGPRRNRIRNSEPESAPNRNEPIDVNPSGEPDFQP
jgi:integrase